MINHRDVHAGAPATSTSALDQIEVPAHLRDVVNDMKLQRQQGTLSDEEFQRRLSRILERHRRAAGRGGARP
jgi:hypothetical protein